MTSYNWTSISEARSDDEYFDSCMRGTKLFGDIFDEPLLAEWFEIEAQGYRGLADLGSESNANTRGWNYAYHGLNKKHAFAHLPKRTFDLTVSLGGFDGSEVLPIADRIRELLIIDPGESIPACPAPLPPNNQIIPDLYGKVDIEDASVDLVCSFSTLHHIANVSDVINESYRILKPGGWMIISDPIVSMGDWRSPRPGLTATERGIPLGIMRRIFRDAGFSIQHESLCMFPTTARLAKFTKLIGRPDIFNLRLAVEFDHFLSRLTKWRYRYDRQSRLEKLTPTQGYFVLTK